MWTDWFEQSDPNNTIERYQTDINSYYSLQTLFICYNTFFSVPVYNKILLDRRYDEPLFIYSRLKKWPFSELFLSDVTLRNQYKIIVFNILSCIILIIHWKILIITVISNEAANELTMYTKLCQKVTIFYWR